MPRIRSLIICCKIDVAQRAHNCQANSKHRIKCGDKRLKVRNGRSWDHYCLECAKVIISNNITKLEELDRELNSDMQEGS